MEQQGEGYWTQTSGARDEGDEEAVQDELLNTPECLVFLIEATPSMLEPTLESAAQPSTSQAAGNNPNRWHGSAPKSKLELVLHCAYALMRGKVIGSPRDKLGIVVFHTRDTKGVGSTSFPNCKIHQDLLQPSAVVLRDFKAFLEDVEQDHKVLEDMFVPAVGDTNVADGLQVCNQLFRSRAPKLATKRICIVTDNDTPTRNEQLIRAASYRKGDLDEMGYEIEPILLQPSDGRDFDLDAFYRPLLSSVAGDLVASTRELHVIRDLTGALDDMIADLRPKEAIKRSAFKLDFVLARDVVIGINGFNLVGEEKKRLPVKVDLQTREGVEVYGKTIYTTEDAEPLDPKRDILRYYQVGRVGEDGEEPKKILVDEQDNRRIKMCGMSPGLNLLGFKPRDKLKWQEHVKHSTFIYPDEDAYTGSTRTFAALHASMLKKNKIGLASLVSRKNAKPQIVIVLPQEEVLSQTGHQAHPPGFHLCPLPFADDMREISMDGEDMSSINRVDEYERGKAREAAATIVNKLRKKTFNPEHYPNPALNLHYDTLAALALEEDIAQVNVQDFATAPRVHTFYARTKDALGSLKLAIKLDEKKQQTSKLKRVKAGDAPSADDISADDFAEVERRLPHIRDGQAKKDEIVHVCKLLGLSSTGNKQQLIDRINAVPWLTPRGESSSKKARIDV